MLTGPGPATRKALAKAGLNVDDIDLFEVNEAFASVVMKFMKDMGVSEDKVNVNGGSIAMGHPLGATGCAILGTLLDELEARQLRYGPGHLVCGRWYGYCHDYRTNLNRRVGGAKRYPSPRLMGIAGLNLSYVPHFGMRARI